MELSTFAPKPREHGPPNETQTRSADSLTRLSAPAKAYRTSGCRAPNGAMSAHPDFTQELVRRRAVASRTPYGFGQKRLVGHAGGCRAGSAPGGVAELT